MFMSDTVQIDAINNNPIGVFAIVLISFFMVYGNGMSILYLIYTNDAISNKQYLNNNIDFEKLEDEVNFYYFTIVFSFISILASHVYGYRNIFKIYLTFVPAYYIYICLFNILFLNYYIIFNDDHCNTRALFNCTNVDTDDIDNSSIIYSINVLIIFEIISVILMFIMSCYFEREKYKNLIIFNLMYGFAVTILPLIIICIITFGEACKDCKDCKPENTNPHERQSVKKAVKNVINTQQINKENKKDNKTMMI